VAAPAADASRVASIRNTIDLTDASALAVFGERARREVVACVDRVLGEVRSSDLVEGDALLAEAERLPAEFDLQPLFKKTLFGNRERRAAVLERFRATELTLEGVAQGLRERAERLQRKTAALEALHGQAKQYVLELDAYLDAGRAAVSAAPRTLAAIGEENAPVVQVAPVEQTGTLARRLDDLSAVRAGAIRELALVRVIQNVDAPLGDRFARAAEAIDAWRRDWRELLGLNRPRKKIRPDLEMLEKARADLAAALAAVRAPLAEERTRRDETERAMQTHAQTARHAVA
jgi:uncharacterized protein YaaN involved in tellurite resistance